MFPLLKKHSLRNYKWRFHKKKIEVAASHRQNQPLHGSGNKRYICVYLFFFLVVCYTVTALCKRKLFCFSDSGLKEVKNFVCAFCLPLWWLSCVLLLYFLSQKALTNWLESAKIISLVNVLWHHTFSHSQNNQPIQAAWRHKTTVPYQS